MTVHIARTQEAEGGAPDTAARIVCRQRQCGLACLAAAAMTYNA